MASASEHSPSIRLQILGPLRVWREGVELSAGPRQQAYLLALLLAREGRPVSTDEIVELMWGENSPASAVNVIHKYIGALRRLLEPALPTRGAGSYFLRRGTGYLCAAGPGALDLVDFRKVAAKARIQMEERRSDVALNLLVEALGLWHGPAGDGLDHGPSAAAIFSKVNDEFFDAAVTAAELAVRLGRPESVLAPLRLAAEMAPFHEPVQASLITALGAAGQQAHALSVFHEVRARLAEDLGVDPGQVLDAAHRRVLGQDLGPTTERTAMAPRARGWLSSPPADDPNAPLPVGQLVGRFDELEVLRQALDRARNGDTGLVLIEGEPGVGKTRLLEEITAEAAHGGALVVWSLCLEGDAAPSMWPWIQVVDAVLTRLTRETKSDWLSGELGVLMAAPANSPSGQPSSDGVPQLRLFQRVVDLLDEVSAQRSLVLVIDDLQWADEASLRLLGYMTSRLPERTVIFGALRDRTPTPNAELVRMLGTSSRAPNQRRIVLGPLSLTDVTEMVRHETGQPPSPAAVRSLYARTDGNPLFVQELTRLLCDGGVLTEAAAARAGVPATVRDVVLGLMSGLGSAAKGLLQFAALIGRQVDLGLLARAAGLGIHECLERLQAVEALGLMGPTPGDPFSLRFTHDLVRESVSAAIPPQRTLQLHLKIADALQHDESINDPAIERLAHHLWSAGPLAEPRTTVDALVRASRWAAAKTALDTAERQLRHAIHVAQSANLVELELAVLSELITVVGMSSPHGTAAMEILERAESLASGLGRQEEAAVLLYSRWMALAYGAQYSRGEALARRLLDQGNASSVPIVRALGLQAWGLQQAAVGNIGEAYRYLTEASQDLLIVPTQRENDVVWFAQQLSALGLLAEMTAVHGDVAGARALLDRLESMAGDDPFKVTVWAVHSVRIASVVGDHAWTLAVTRKGIAADPDLSFGFFGMYQRLARHWALAMAGQDPNGSADEVQRLITENLLDPPRSDIATWYGLLAEMRLAAGAFELAATALDRANEALDTYGQRYSEGLILLVQARLLQARGRPVAEVRAAASAARRLSVAREAHVFAQRADEFLADVRTFEPLGSGVEPTRR